MRKTTFSFHIEFINKCLDAMFLCSFGFWRKAWFIQYKSKAKLRLRELAEIKLLLWKALFGIYLKRIILSSFEFLPVSFGLAIVRAVVACKNRFMRS